MTRIALLRPPVYANRQFIDYPYFASFGLWQVAYALRQKGHDVVVHDALSKPTASISIEEDGYFRLGCNDRTWRKSIQGLRDIEWSLIHMDPFNVQDPSGRGIGQTNRLMQDAGYFGKIVLADLYVGGMNYIAHNPVMWLGTLPQVKTVLLYEAENSLDTWLESGELPEKLQEGTPAKELAMGAGLYEGVGEDFKKFLSDCLSKLKRPNEFKITPTSLPMKMTRGCAHQCSFCTCHFKGGKQRTPWRKVNLEALDEAMTWAVSNGFDKLIMLDEAANLDMDFFRATLDRVEAHGLKLEFPNGLRADCLDQDIVKRLSNLISLLSISPESGSPTVAENIIGKRMSPEASRKVAQWAKDADLPTAMHFIIGLPGETRQTILETFQFARSCYEKLGALPLIQYAIALPGTSLFMDAMERRLLPAPLPVDFSPFFQKGPMLKDGACEVSNTELISWRRDFYRDLGLRSMAR